jgi:hypothetical protein
MDENLSNEQQLRRKKFCSEFSASILEEYNWK